MTLLLLAGTGEARAIAAGLAADGIGAVASLAGATQVPKPLALPTRVGGFGGEAGFRAYLAGQEIRAVLDATHPFANRISLRTARVCDALGLPYCQYLRPGWVPEAGDDWTWLADEAEAARHVPESAVVFLATGRSTLERFASLAGRRLICRVVDPPEAPFPFADGEFLVGRPPFSVAEEEALFQRLGVNWLIVKNAGGAASRSKLIAARTLGIRVGMIERPAQPDGCRVDSVEAALDWVRGGLA